MRTSIIARSVVALATLSLGSAALVAAPAHAASPTGVTRETVLTAANGLRAAGDESPATIKALRSILSRECKVDPDNAEAFFEFEGAPTQAGGSADGLVAYARIVNFAEGTTRDCVVGVVAASGAGAVLSGTATLTLSTDPGPTAHVISVPLSGDVAATAPFNAANGTLTGEPSFTATGAATTTTKVPAQTVKDKKSKAQKKAAKKKYAKKLKSLKKAYDKAIDRAGSSKSKKAKAKKTYSTKKKAAKDAYRYAIANYKIVKKATTTTDARPFNLALQLL